jgi:dinuclear metal center YbgI/SA1388 family protein
MPASTADIIAFLDELLEVDGFPDLGPNGLQVPGGQQVTTVLTGVSAQRALFERAIEEDAQLVIAHHGILWDFEPRRIGPAHATRLKLLLANDVALAGYHLPLDAHPEHGNNALLARELGLTEIAPFGEYRGAFLGRQGRFEPPLSHAALAAKVKGVVGGEPLMFPFGPEPVRTIGIISGGAVGDFSQAIAQRLDAYLTGEVKEHVQELAREERVTYVAAGHYRTETFGVRSLGERITREFGIPCEFLDVPNPV